MAWSPDGEYIAFASSRMGFKDEVLYTDAPQPYGELFVMRSTARILSNSPITNGKTALPRGSQLQPGRPQIVSTKFDRNAEGGDARLAASQNCSGSALRRSSGLTILCLRNS